MRVLGRMGLSERTNVGMHHIERCSVKCVHWSDLPQEVKDTLEVCVE